MKNMMFLIFFSIVTTIYFLGCWYLFSRGNHALAGSSYRTAFRWSFWLLAVSFMAGQFLERMQPMLISRIITYIGSLWLIILWYSILMVVFIDLVRLSNHFIHYIPANVTATIFTGPKLFTGVLSIAVLLMLGGYLNAAFPRVNPIDIKVDKPNPGYSELKIAVVSDIHMGFIIGNNRVKRLVKKLNEQKPDLIIFAGDLVDHNPLPVIKYNMGRYFKELNPPLGILAVTGNHEYIGHPEVSINYLSQFGIKYIRDSVVQIDGNILFVGRDDRDKGRFTGKPRKTIEELLKGADKSKFIIVGDHQPVEYNEVAEQGVDFMVSGHTHSGQIWPFNYLTNKIFMNDNGHMQIGNTHFYVSPGYGTWGPPVRLGNRPEIALLKLKFE